MRDKTDMAFFYFGPLVEWNDYVAWSFYLTGHLRWNNAIEMSYNTTALIIYFFVSMIGHMVLVPFSLIIHNYISVSLSGLDLNNVISGDKDCIILIYTNFLV